MSADKLPRFKTLARPQTRYVVGMVRSLHTSNIPSKYQVWHAVNLVIISWGIFDISPSARMLLTHLCKVHILPPRSSPCTTSGRFYHRCIQESWFQCRTVFRCSENFHAFQILLGGARSQIWCLDRWDSWTILVWDSQWTRGRWCFSARCSIIDVDYFSQVRSFIAEILAFSQNIKVSLVTFEV